MKLHLLETRFPESIQVVYKKSVGDGKYEITWPERLKGEIFYSHQLKKLPEKYQSLTTDKLTLLGPEEYKKKLKEFKETCENIPSIYDRKDIVEKAYKHPKLFFGGYVLSNRISSLSDEGLVLVIADIEKALRYSEEKTNLYDVKSALESILRLRIQGRQIIFSKNPNTSELINFIRSNMIEENANFEHIRKISKLAILHSSNMELKEKKQWILGALECIAQDGGNSLLRETVILTTIETMLLSKFYSNLKSLNVFSTEVLDNNNHSWFLSGAQRVISILYPNLPVYFLTLSNEWLHKELVEMALKTNSRFWLVVDYENKLHLTLLRVDKTSKNINIQVFDSIGIKPKEYEFKNNEYQKYSSYLHEFVQKFSYQFQEYSMNVSYSTKPRQKDNVNCFSFVLSDLEIDSKNMHNIEHGGKSKSIKGIKRTNTILPEAFNIISQNDRLVPTNYLKEWSYCKTTESKSLVNPRALKTSAKALIALIKADQITFYNAHIKENLLIEENVDKKNSDCKIM